MEINVHDAWEGKSLKDLDMRVNYGVNVMAIKHAGSINISPRGEDVVENGDTLVVIGSNEDIRRLEKRT